MDEVDLQWLRFGLSAAGAIAGGGVGLVVSIQYLSFACVSLECAPGATALGLSAAWAAVGAVAGGLWGWRRDVPTGVVAALFLAFLALHFVAPATWMAYGPLLDTALATGVLLAGGTGHLVAFFVYWTGAAAVGVVLVWQGARAVQWTLARWEGADGGAPG